MARRLVPLRRCAPQPLPLSGLGGAFYFPGLVGAFPGEIPDTITKYATLANAQAYAADPYDEPIMFVCDLTGWSVDDHNFDAMCERLEDAFDALLATAARNASDLATHNAFYGIA